jgi:hypothetical protein
MTLFLAFEQCSSLLSACICSKTKLNERLVPQCIVPLTEKAQRTTTPTAAHSIVDVNTSQAMWRVPAGIQRKTNRSKQKQTRAKIVQSPEMSKVKACFPGIVQCRCVAVSIFSVAIASQHPH